MEGQGRLHTFGIPDRRPDTPYVLRLRCKGESSERPRHEYPYQVVEELYIQYQRPLLLIRL